MIRHKVACMRRGVVAPAATPFRIIDARCCNRVRASRGINAQSPQDAILPPTRRHMVGNRVVRKCEHVAPTFRCEHSSSPARLQALQSSGSETPDLPGASPVGVLGRRRPCHAHGGTPSAPAPASALYALHALQRLPAHQPVLAARHHQCPPHWPQSVARSGARSTHWHSTVDQ